MCRSADTYNRQQNERVGRASSLAAFEDWSQRAVKLAQLVLFLEFYGLIDHLFETHPFSTDMDEVEQNNRWHFGVEPFFHRKNGKSDFRNYLANVTLDLQRCFQITLFLEQTSPHSHSVQEVFRDQLP